MPWLYLFIASLFEIVWTFCLKFLDFKKVAAIHWLQFFTDKTGILTLAPLIGYIICGLGNIVCFSIAIKQIPASTALAVWMGVTLVGVKLVDIAWFKESTNLLQVFFVMLILIGIVGLKRGS